MVIQQGGNVGIGTTNPLAKLSVNGYIKAQGSDGRLMLENPSASTSIYIRNQGNSNQRKLEVLYGSTAKFVMDNDGNVGIGTTAPDPAFKLSVNGSIRAKEVKVETGWADYVFDEDYRLSTLSEVSDFIDENHHLPGIPSAEEVGKDGINLGEMNAKLLEKIEELTLYLIDQNDQIKSLRAENEDFKNRLGKLEDR